MSAFLRGTLDEQIAFAYEVYDLNGDRSIGREEVHHLLRQCINPLPGVGLAAIDPEEVADASRDIVEMAMQKLDVDKNGVITFGDFHDGKP
jgi:Ca2+-binding EF-hand superfamily protein